jgi:hypothetical protein
MPEVIVLLCITVATLGAAVIVVILALAICALAEYQKTARDFDRYD